MSTKTKPSKKMSTPDSLESKLSDAIEMASAKKNSDAIPIFETVAKEATKNGNYGLARVANSYIANKQQKKVAPVKIDPIQEAVYLLNANQPEVALQKVDSIIKAKNTGPNVYYLKALALASTQQFELSAECLQKAIDLDPMLLHVYRLEPDFKPCRKLSSFADFELA